MTYNVLMGMLNPTQSLTHLIPLFDSLFQVWTKQCTACGRPVPANTSDVNASRPKFSPRPWPQQVGLGLEHLALAWPRSC